MRALLTILILALLAAPSWAASQYVASGDPVTTNFWNPTTGTYGQHASDTASIATAISSTAAGDTVYVAIGDTVSITALAVLASEILVGDPTQADRPVIQASSGASGILMSPAGGSVPNFAVDGVILVNSGGTSQKGIDLTWSASDADTTFIRNTKVDGFERAISVSGGAGVAAHIVVENCELVNAPAGAVDGYAASDVIGIAQYPFVSLGDSLGTANIIRMSGTHIDPGDNYVNATGSVVAVSSLLVQGAGAAVIYIHNNTIVAPPDSTDTGFNATSGMVLTTFAIAAGSGTYSIQGNVFTINDMNEDNDYASSDKLALLKLDNSGNMLGIDIASAARFIDGLEIKGNTFGGFANDDETNAKTFSLYIVGSDTADGTWDDLEIADNVFTGNEFGIWGGAIGGVVIQNNWFDGNEEEAIQLVTQLDHIMLINNAFIGRPWGDFTYAVHFSKDYVTDLSIDDALFVGNWFWPDDGGDFVSAFRPFGNSSAITVTNGIHAGFLHTGLDPSTVNYWDTNGTDYTFDSIKTLAGWGTWSGINHGVAGHRYLGANSGFLDHMRRMNGRVAPRSWGGN